MLAVGEDVGCTPRPCSAPSTPWPRTRAADGKRFSLWSHPAPSLGGSHTAVLGTPKMRRGGLQVLKGVLKATAGLMVALCQDRSCG